MFVEQTKCKNKQQLDEKLTSILNKGGEGLMIRQPGSQYERTRSKTLLKIKKFYDAEVMNVIYITECSLTTSADTFSIFVKACFIASH